MTSTVTTDPLHRPFALISGAARGIGAAIARQLARDGFDLVLTDAPSPNTVPDLSYQLASQEQLAASALACRELGAVVLTRPADVRSESQLAAVVALVPTGRLQVAVAVAGLIGSDKRAWEFSRADLDRDLDTNFHGVANMARLTVPQLLLAPHGLGRFIAIVSTAGESGLPRLASYVSAKHAALGYIRSLAADLGPLGVTANAVLPGSTRTDILTRSARAYDLTDREDFAPHQRVGRLLEPDEIATAVSWLAQPGSAAVTGAAIRVDGGFVG